MIGGKFDGIITDIVIKDKKIYAAGRFTEVGDMQANSIVRWDGNSWSALGAGIQGSVYDLAVIGDDIYVTGRFDSAGTVNAQNIAKWNGSAWAPLGKGVNGTANGIASHNGKFYIIGGFTKAGDMPANNIATWDGKSWSGLGSGIESGPSDIVIANNGDVYIGGDFTEAGDIQAAGIVKWDGENWSTLGRGVEDPSGRWDGGSKVCFLAVDDDRVYASGYFTLAGKAASVGIAVWDMVHNTWAAIPNAHDKGITLGVNALAIHGKDVYIGGDLHSAGKKHVNGIAKFQDNEWHALGEGIDGRIDVITITDKGTVYAGGRFRTAGNLKANNIAQWDGQQWQALGDGLDSDDHIYAMATKGDTLYVSGLIRTPNRQDFKFKRLYQWDGHNWSMPGGGLPLDFDTREFPDPVAVHAIAVIGNDVYIGGQFIFVGDLQTAIPNLACWNGKEWDAVGGGRFNDTVKKMAVYRNELYVAGEFTKISRLTVNGIAKWDGHEWSGFGEDNPALQYHQALTVSRGRVFLAGNTSNNHNNHSQSDVFMLDNGIWQPLGDGVQGVRDEGNSHQAIHALGVHGNELFVGGEFYYAAANGREVLSANLAMWHLPKDPNISMPVWSKLPAISFPEDSAATLALDQFTGDANYASTDLVFTADILNHSTGDASDLQINIDPSTHIAAFTTAENANGNFTVAFNATNPDQMTSSDTLQVVVRAVNDAPVIDGLPDEMILHPDEPAEIALWDYVADAETPDSLLQYDLSVSDDALTLNFNESTGTLMLQASNLNDVADVFITVRDDSNTAVRDTVQVKIETTTGVTSNENNIPAAFALLQNYPNPVVRGVQSSAGTATMFRFALPQAADVKLEVYTLAGQRVATVLNERRKSGFHQVGFQARNLSSGVYFYRLTAGNFRAMRKLLVVR